MMIACLGVSVQSYAQTCTDVPVINNFEPNTGFIGSIVEIFGANFDAQVITNNQVYFGATQAEVISATFGKLEVIVPVGASTAPISVKNQCDLTAYSKVAFNGIFCPTPIDNQTYQNTAFELGGVFGAYNMISQDMDLDGKPDVVSSGLNGGITIAMNNSTPGNLNFSAYNFPAGTRSVFAADFDGDGLKDLVTNESVLRNTSTGPGNFGLAVAHSSQGISGYQVAAGDFNNDGKVDIVGENGNVAWIAFNTSTGPGNFSFTARQVLGNVGSRCTGIQVADIDGDGKTDFVASQGGANRAVTIRNTTSAGSLTVSAEAPEFWASDSNPADGTGTFPYRAQIADFDKDGKIDFTSCNYLGVTNVAIWRNISTVGDIVFAPTVNIPSPTRNYRIGVGDVDGDGFPDVVTKSLGINVFSVYKNTSAGPGAPTFATRVDYTSSSRAEVSGIVIGDLDGDFVPDIATSGISSNTIRFHRNTSAQNDVDPPTAIAQDVVVALSPDGTVTVTADQVDNGSSDACGIDTIVLSKTDFTCDDIGENNVTLTVTDNAGNVSTADAIVNVQPAAIIVSGQTTVCQGETIPLNANLGDSYQWFNNGVAIPGATSQQYIATVTGSYTVAVTNAGGCSGTSLPTEVTVNENPTVDVFPSGTAYICPPTGTAVLTASQSAIYQWMKDGVDIPNATQQVYTATTVGNYSVRVIDLFGCSAESDEITVAANPPEIDVAEGATAIATGSLSDYGDVFPNVDNVKTFTINNTGANALDISQILVNGADVQYFSIVGAPTAVAANSSATFDLVFNAPNITTYSASVTIVSNDCDEGNITFDVAAEITCVAAGLTVPSETVMVNTTPDRFDGVANYSVELTGNPSPTVTYSFSGATSGNGQGTGSGSVFNHGVTTVMITVENACGTETGTFDVEVVDAQAPNAVARDITVQLDENGNMSISPQQVDNGSSDNSGGTLTYALDQTDFDCNDVDNASPCGGTAVDFNSANNYIDASDNAWFPDDQVDDYTYEAWINMDDINTLQGIVDYAWTVNTNEPHSGIWIANGQLEARVRSDNGASGYFISMRGGNLTPNQWHHAAFTKSGSTYSLYLDGVLVNSQQATINPSWTFTGRTKLLIGSLWNTSVPQGPLNGRLDEVRIWSTGRTLEEINAGKDTCIDPNQTGLEHYYKMNEGSGATVTDATPRNNTGVFMNFSGNNHWITGAPVSVSGTVVTLTVTDPSGNTATATANVTVEDNISPEITAPSDINVFATSAAGAVVNYATPVGTDNCTVTTALTAGLADGATFPIGTTLVTYTATDASGNTASASFNVTVTGIPPQIVVPADITVSNDAGECGAIVNYEATETTAIPGSVITYDIQPGTFFPVGTTTVTATATNAVGTSTDSFTVTVEDNEAPIVTAENISIDLDATGHASIYVGDLFGGMTPEQIAALANNYEEVGAESADVEGEEDVEEYEVPGAGSAYNDFYELIVELSDNCGIVSVVADKTDFDCSNVGDNTVTITVTDGSNNSTVVEAIVTVNDVTAPTALAQNLTIALDENGNATIQPSDIDAGSSDACGVSLSIDNGNFDCNTLGANTVTLTVTDPSGNSATATAVVTIVDDAGPTITPNPVTVQLDENGQASITVDQVQTTIDNCGVASVTIDTSTFNCDDLGANTVTITATDVNGNITTQEVTVTVEDVITPIVSTRDISIDLDENGNATINPEDVLILSEDDIDTEQNCQLSAAEHHAMWLSQYVKADNGYGKNHGSYRGKGKKWGHYTKPRNTRYLFDADGGTLTRNTDGTATVTGTLISTEDSDDRWEVSLSLVNARNWTEWSALGRSYKDEKGLAGNRYQDWTYYEMSADSKLIGAGANIGTEVALSHAPSSYHYGFQVGEAANSKNGNYGMSGWFFYTNRQGKTVQGDFNLDVTNCEAEPLPSETQITSDNCSIASTSLSVSSFDCTNLGANTIQVTVTDQSGNSTTRSVNVTVNDNIAPVARAKDITVSLASDGTVTVDPSQLDDGSTDNTDCALTFTLSRTDFDCDDIHSDGHKNRRGKGHNYGDDDDDNDPGKGKGKGHKKEDRGHKVTLTVTDAAGNSSSTEAYIKVVDDIAPTISSEPIQVVVYGRYRVYLNKKDVRQRVSDNCDVKSIRYPRTRFTRNDVGMNQVTVTAKDLSGNETIGTVNVDVIDISHLGRRVEMCYKGRRIRVSRHAVQHFMRKGATIGSCTPDLLPTVEGGTAITESEITDLTDKEPLLELSASPNPVVSSTTITFLSEYAGRASVGVYTMQGVEVARLFEGDIQANRDVEVTFNTDKVPSGLLLVRLQTQGQVKTLKLIVRK